MRYNAKQQDFSHWLRNSEHCSTKEKVIFPSYEMSCVWLLVALEMGEHAEGDRVLKEGKQEETDSWKGDLLDT